MRKGRQTGQVHRRLAETSDLIRAESRETVAETAHAGAGQRPIVLVVACRRVRQRIRAAVRHRRQREQRGGDALSAFNTAQGSIDDITNALQKPIDGAATLSSDLADAMNKAGIGRDTAIGKQIWQQIDALDKTVNTQQGQLDAFHKDTSQFISSGKSAATSLRRHQHRHRQRHRHTQPRTHDAHRNRHPEPDRGIEQLRHAQRHNRRHAVIAVIHARPVRQPV